MIWPLLNFFNSFGIDLTLIKLIWKSWDFFDPLKNLKILLEIFEPILNFLIIQKYFWPSQNYLNYFVTVFIKNNSLKNLWIFFRKILIKFIWLNKFKKKDSIYFVSKFKNTKINFNKNKIKKKRITFQLQIKNIYHSVLLNNRKKNEK